MKTLLCMVCGQESYSKKEGSKTAYLCAYGHHKAYSVEEWNNTYANKVIHELQEKIDKLEEEWDAALMALDLVQRDLDSARQTLDRDSRLIRERDEARNMVRKLLDPDWQAAGIEKKAFRTLKDWGF